MTTIKLESGAYDMQRIDSILSKLRAKLKRQQSFAEETMMELEHWTKIQRSQLDILEDVATKKEAPNK